MCAPPLCLESPNKRHSPLLVQAALTCISSSECSTSEVVLVTYLPCFCRPQAFCCFAQSVASTRFMTQDELQLQNTKCDNCLIGTMICLQYLSCFCDILACLTANDDIRQIAAAIDCIADVMWCT